MNLSHNLKGYEVVEADYSNSLIGGFSSSFSSSKNAEEISGEGSNNCLGGNCAPGCGMYGNNDANCHNNIQPHCGS
ncbi:hypothetical protein GCM10022289_31590 [Pedobacter jeongneungensis]|uniref:Natural product n=1 Tax=Pedobacter jeongneungensis TaxID=947309 RepID=A0ABP8BJ12_9SPHI